MDNEKDSHRNRLLQYLAYALQAYDAANSVKSFRQGGYEANPWMAPFSHGGLPTMLLGGALQDVARDQVGRVEHLDAGQQNTELLGRILASLIGIIQTNRSRMGAHVNPLNLESSAVESAPLVIPLFTKKF